MRDRLAAAVAAAFGGAERGAPDEAAIKRLVARDRAGIVWRWVEIGAGRAASAWEARQFEAAPGQMLYPVRLSYAVVRGGADAAERRDYLSSLVAFRARAGRGPWTLRSNAQRDDLFGTRHAA